MYELYPHQATAKAEVYQGWESGNDNMLLVKPTGAGKTVVLSSIAHDFTGAMCTIAHRQELVSQISLAMMRQDTPHRIIGPDAIVSDITRQHVAECGMSYVDRRGQKAVAGVDTLIRRGDQLNGWLAKVGLWIIDEAHHVLAENKWGKACDMFPNAKGLGVTATPIRADGAGLGRDSDGLFDKIVEGPDMAWLIANGYLTPYTIYAPKGDFDVSQVPVSAGGDFSKPKLKAAAKKSHIVGDVIDHYRRFVDGKCGVVFASDVEIATEMAANFNANGITAEVVSAKTPDAERAAIIRRFRAGEIKVLTNCDLFGEGFDLPAIEFVIMARPTMSFSLYAQQFGRALRIMEGKSVAYIIDCVGNVDRHKGPPDRPRVWSLDRRERRSRSSHDPDLIPTRTCIECTAVYSAVFDVCPYCGKVHTPVGRSGPEQVDGDLIELDADALNQLYGEIRKVDQDPERLRQGMMKGGKPAAVINGAVKNHRLRQEAQTNLRNTMALWGGKQKQLGRDKSEAHKRFFWRFGIDVASAQALGRKDAEELTVRVATDLM